MLKTKSLFLLLCLIFLSCDSHVKDKMTDGRGQKTNATKLEIEKTERDSIEISRKIQLGFETKEFDVEKAKAIFENVLQEIEYKEYNSVFLLKKKAAAYNGLGECAYDQSNNANALNYFLKSVKISEKVNDSVGMGNVYHNLGYLYYGKGDSIKANYYTRKAIKIRQGLGEEHSYDLAMTFNVLGLSFQELEQPDSALYYFEKAKEANQSEDAIVFTNSNIAFVYTGQKKYEKAIPLFEESIKLMRTFKDYSSLSSHYQNLGYIYRKLKDYDRAITLTDSAIFYAQAIGNKKQLETEYFSRHSIYKLKGDYKRAYEDYKRSITYLDSIQNVEELNRFTELDLKYQFDKEKEITTIKFDKEKEIATIKLDTETSKKKLYLALLIVSVLSGLFLIYVIRKNHKQKLKLAENKVELKQVEKLKTELALANRETELKKIVIENSITEEVLNKTLEDIKGIITFENEKERQIALKTLSASLLSEKTTKKTSTNLQSYLDEIHIDFKIVLDTHFTQLNPREKELLCLMKTGLNSTEISKLQNNTVAAIKSSRYRIRKKLGLDSKQDIVAFIENRNITL